jgi:heme O synthase-like polyprenyltransferase
MTMAGHAVVSGRFPVMIMTVMVVIMIWLCKHCCEIGNAKA